LEGSVNPFLTLYTSTYRRPQWLLDCVASAQRQTDPDYEHILHPDPVGIGIAGVHQRIAEIAPRLGGQYVYLLNDDDVLVDDHLIADLKVIARDADPDVIMVRVAWDGRVIPEDDCWRREPRMGHVGSSTYVVRREVFQRFAAEFRPVYEGDYWFIRAIWDAGCSFYWHDVVAVATPHGSNHGKPEGG
jgi:GT2 family glycosyltransferase